MNTPGFIFYAIILVIATLAWIGISDSSISIILVGLGIGAIPWYFGTRDRSNEPSLFERILAFEWVWCRRILCIPTGIFMLYGSYRTVFSETTPQEAAIHSPWIGAGIFLLLGVFYIYVGLFGQGNRRSDWRDDIKLHQENKRRYRWRI